MIEVRDVYKRFGSNEVLRGVSLTIEPGKTTAVVGPSGVGKSVLLKIIMGMLHPDQGEVLIDGKSMTALRNEQDRNELRATLGVLFQSAALLDSLSIFENIAFPLLERTRLSQREVEGKVSKVIEALSLETFALALPQEVSLGIRKRAGLARALVTEPNVVLFDEPNTGLDPLAGQEVYDLIKSSRKRFGFAGLVISHEIPEVFQLADNVAMLLGGKIVALGSPDELMQSSDPAIIQFLSGDTEGPIRIQ